MLKNKFKSKKKELFGGAAIIALCSGVYLLGRKHGERALVENVINLYEDGYDNYHNIDWPVFTSRRKDLGSLMYEIRTECIGD